ncbi:MAG: proteasome accessory factor PafA2 family protein, partial [Verrucomicrobiota bacterium]
QAFLVTRQIFAGAGKFGVEAEDKFLGPGFQLSQRSDFFSELQSVDTMQRRPIINTRDEPHANAKIFRRFHVILGDANMSPFATRLKVGSTALTLEALIRDPNRVYPRLADPLGTLVSISRDPSFRWEFKLEENQPTTALAVQWHYLNAVKALCDLTARDRAAVVADWEVVLHDLEEDVLRCRNRLDWVAKWSLVRSFQEAQQLSDEDPWLQSLDLEYHRLDTREGLYYGLEQSGEMLGVPEENRVRQAITEPPRTTRAYVRGRCIQKFPAAIVSAQWDHVTLQGSHGLIKISLLDLFAPEEILHYANCVDAAQSPDDLQSLGNVPL